MGHGQRSRCRRGGGRPSVSSRSRSIPPHFRFSRRNREPRPRGRRCLLRSTTGSAVQVGDAQHVRRHAAAVAVAGRDCGLPVVALARIRPPEGTFWAESARFCFHEAGVVRASTIATLGTSAPGQEEQRQTLSWTLSRYHGWALLLHACCGSRALVAAMAMKRPRQILLRRSRSCLTGGAAPDLVVDAVPVSRLGATPSRLLRQSRARGCNGDEAATADPLAAQPLLSERRSRGRRHRRG
jgi:hypothetical protein